jgi:outer membrane protein, heavy metal efflux system
MRNFILFTVIIIISQLKLVAQDAVVVRLDTLLSRIESNYPAILVYRENTQSWQAKADGAKAWMPPTFSSGLMQFPYDLSLIKEKDDPMNQAGFVFSIEQMIPNNSKLNANRNYYNSLAEVENSKSQWTINELRKEAKILYYSRYTNEKKQQIITESEEILNLFLSTAEARFSNNQSQLQTIYKAKARLAELKNMNYMLTGNITESNIGLNILMVREVQSKFEIDTFIQPRKYTVSLQDSSMILNRSDIAAMSKSIQSMKLEQQTMRIGTRPDFGIRAEHAAMLGMPNQWSLMGMITLPIVPWSSKMYSSEVRSIDFRVQSMELEKQKMQLMAQRMVAEKLSMLNYGYGQYENYVNEIIPAFENNLQANIRAYNQNTSDFFELLDAWEMLLMKKIEMLDQLFSILKLEAEYEYEIQIN